MINEDLRREHKWRNGLQTVLLVAASLGLLMLCAYAIAGGTGLLWALIGGGIALYAGTNASPHMVLALYRARPLPPQVFPEGHHILRTLAARAGLPVTPQLYYVPSQMMNAFAVGHGENAVVCVTDGLLRGLNGREFAGVIAHELSHIRNGDVRVMALADVVSRMTGTMSMIGLFLLLLNLPALVFGGYGVPWLLILILVAAPGVGTLVQLALSRTREFDADLGAVELTGDTQGLASALLKLEQRGRLWQAMAFPGGRVPDPSILRTHPQTEERVRRLQSLSAPQARDVFGEGRLNVAGEDVGPSASSFVPKVGRPRYRARGMGLWY